MINEQEQAIARIQQNMNYFIQEALGVLEDNILDKEEIISEKEAIELERTEYFRTLDELAAIYAEYPAVRSIKQYVHLSNFLWESTFIESITMS